MMTARQGDHKKHISNNNPPRLSPPPVLDISINTSHPGHHIPAPLCPRLPVSSRRGINFRASFMVYGSYLGTEKTMVPLTEPASPHFQTHFSRLVSSCRLVDRNDSFVTCARNVPRSNAALYS
ncbi:hypothetical protein E2C01_028655 [Portunus trituberculatus]|uniref:Uncharacterized protein n=1 Tax=Portunus trituberculatus TaxID=210409 RepID=A0A5B7EPT0_PORTR|nr:hypothetical protein [Portunus trituberculatus]